MMLVLWRWSKEKVSECYGKGVGAINANVLNKIDKVDVTGETVPALS